MNRETRPEHAPWPHSTSGAREVASEQLLGAARQIRIWHRGEWYTLRQTANDKLILTK